MALKIKPLSSLRTKLLLTYLLLGAVVLVVGVSLHFNRRRERVSKVVQQHIGLQGLFFKMGQLEGQFYAYELTSSAFYVRGTSPVLGQHQALLGQVNAAAGRLSRQQETVRILPDTSFAAFGRSLANYKEIFNRIVAFSLERGFKDYGHEGAMRRYAHILEEDAPDLEPAQLLMLRRHEKDYLIRRDTVYAHQFRTLNRRLRNMNATTARTDSLLVRYGQQFEQIVLLDGRLGLSSRQGLRGQVLQLRQQQEGHLQRILREAE